MYKKHILKVATAPLLVTISVITTVIILLLVFYNSHREHEASIKMAKSDLTRLSQVVSSNLTMSFISVDQTLQRAAERQYFNLLFGKTLRADMEHSLALWVNETPHINAMFFTNTEGVVDVLFKKGQNNFLVSPGYKFSAEQHFAKHKNNPDIDTLISVSKSGNNSRIFASRRIENLEGNFGGLVVAVMDGEYITSFLSALERDKKIKVAIFIDGKELPISGMGFDENSGLLKSALAEIQKNGPAKEKIIEKYVNNEFMLFSFENLKNLPVSISLSVDEDYIFASWRASRNNSIMMAIILACFVATVTAFAYVLDKKMKSARDAESKALMASQTKSDFLAKMSHELRTPLNAIIGFSDMLSTAYFGPVTTAQIERLSDINMCGNHLLEFINDILDFSKGDAGKLRLKEEVVDMYDIACKTVRIMEQKAKLGGITIINQVPKDINAIYGDRRKLKQMMINLLSNAIKFTRRGGSVTVFTRYDDKGDMVFTIKDTGIGIEAKDIPRAMAVFEQIHNGDDHSGSGLGLPLCKMFSEMHGGQFILTSEIGVGTQASFVLPYERVRKSAFKEKMMATMQ